jgi:dipeptidase, putative
MKYKNEISKFIEESKDEMLKDIGRLVAINSERGISSVGKPYGEGPYKALIEAMSIAESFGFDTKNYDNYVGCADMNDKEKGLDILAHMDIVPAGDNWTITDPFKMLEQDGKIYGRGTADDKGPAIAALYAMRAIKELKIPLRKNVRLILGTDEECGSSDIDYYYSLEEEAPATFSPDAEFPIINIEKGRLASNFRADLTENMPTEWECLAKLKSFKAGIKSNVVPSLAKAVIELEKDSKLTEDIEKVIDEVSKNTGIKFEVIHNTNTNGIENDKVIIEIHAFGENAHAAMPETGNNAITGLLKLLAQLPLAETKSFKFIKGLSVLFPHDDILGEGLGIKMEDELSGELTISLGILNLDENMLEGNFDCRAPIMATDKNLKDVITKNMKKYDIELDETPMVSPHYVPKETAFVQTLLRCYEEYTGLKGECLAIGGGTYVHDLKNGVAFGCAMPETDNRMHKPDEFAVIEELIVSAKIFAQVIVELCG